MTEKQALEIMEKTVINGSPHINIAEYIEALEISIDVLGADYTSEQLKNWILVNKYPFLMPKYWNAESMTYEADEDYDYSFTELDEVPIGWRKAFGEMLCEEIKEELVRCNYLDEFRIVQAKEKFGGLRIYTNGEPVDCKVQQIIDKYSVLSENICIVCGKPDVPITGTNWVIPLCKKCFCTPNDYFSQRHTKEDIDAFKAEREKEWEEDYAEDGEMQDSYTVHKWSKENGDEEVTYDISETANKIRAKWREKHGE